MQISNKKLHVILRIAICILCITPVANAQSPHAAQLYGMTQYGGTEHKGTIFHYTPSTKAVTIDYEFTVKVKGKSPKCDLVTPGNGKYYGTATSGGAQDAGVIFEYDSASGNYTEVHNFSIADGQDPRGAMQLYNGKLYGMTNLGGSLGYGVIYEWDFVNNTYIKMYDMDSVNGKNPDGSLTLIGNLFYGFARYGGSNDMGVIFEWNPVTNVYTKKYDFDGSKGSNPVGKFSLYSNKLYAMTNTGGVNNMGVIYEWNYTTNVVTKKIDFNGTNGSFPTGRLTLYTNNKFYGLTYEGGIYEGPSPLDHFGVIFEWNPANNAYVKKRDLGQLTFGQQSSHGPIGSFAIRGTALWAINTEGVGSGGPGAIFEWNPITNAFTDRYLNNPRPLFNSGGCEEYGNPSGRNSYSTFLVSGNKLLATSSSDAGGYQGCIFEYFPDSNQITRSVHMLSTNGSFPKGSFVRAGKKLYALTYQGGNNHNGSIIEWDMQTQQFTERFQFDGYNTGIKPKGSLTWYNGKFYGINSQGRSSYNAIWSSYGTRKTGDFFSWDPVTNVYQSLHSSVSTAASFTLFNNKLYTTQNGSFTDPVSGTIGYGAIVALDPATNAVQNAAILPTGTGSFANIQDKESGNGLIVYNGKLYGMTPAKGPSGNINFKGTIYEWNPSSTLTTNRFDFNDSSGYYPTADLLQVGNEFYGLTVGYINSFFKWNPATGQLHKKLTWGASSTPVYSEGKVYYMADGVVSFVIEYDPLLDTIISVSLPTFPGPGPVMYDWFDYNCAANAYQKLLEVIPNQDPVLVNSPLAQTSCSNQSDTAQFIITDADMDTLSFQISSSNTTLLPAQNISISHTDSLYIITYLSSANQTGSTLVTVSANDGYGGNISFSFTIQVNPSPTATVLQNVNILTANPANASYQWIDCANAVAIAGANNINFTPASNGAYAVVVTNGNFCSDTSACLNYVATSLPSILTNSSVSIYPNPAKNILQLQAEPKLIGSVYTVYDNTGKVVISGKIMSESTLIQLENLSSGVYLLSVGENMKQVFSVINN